MFASVRGGGFSVADVPLFCAGGAGSSLNELDLGMLGVKATSQKILRCRLDRGASVFFTAVALAATFFNSASCAAYKAAQCAQASFGPGTSTNTVNAALSILGRAGTVPPGFDACTGPSQYKLLLCGLAIAVLAKTAPNRDGVLAMNIVDVNENVRELVDAKPEDICTLVLASRSSDYMTFALRAVGESLFAKVSDKLFYRFPKAPLLQAGTLALDDSAYYPIQNAAVLVHYLVRCHYASPALVATCFSALPPQGQYVSGNAELVISAYAFGT